MDSMDEVTSRDKPEPARLLLDLTDFAAAATIALIQVQNRRRIRRRNRVHVN